jgi:FtsP/CotA-like multicopper oxidase with cupredoxin domain
MNDAKPIHRRQPADAQKKFLAADRMSRRHFFQWAGIATSGLCLAPRFGLAQMAAAGASAPPPPGAANYTLRIGTGLVELTPDQIISTITYNGQFPGPLLRFKEGRQVVVDIFNGTDTPEQLHWHGQFLPVDVDGAAEEGTPFISAHGMRRIAFTPGPAGFRFYHTHLAARDNLNAGQYSGQLGPVYIQLKNEPGAYDQEVFLVLEEFEPSFSRGGDMPMDFLAPADRVKALEDRGESAMKSSLAKGMPHGYEVGYSLFSINGRMLGHGEPVRVKPGQRVLFHILNGSATEIRSLALPGHKFKVVALDGNPVPAPAEVPMLWIGTAERVSAIVEMNHPGVWVLGDLDDDDREHGMGIVVEYAARSGKPKWSKPEPFHWDYTQFAAAGAVARKPDEIIEMTFAKRNAADHGFNVWTINDLPFSMEKMEPMFPLHQGRRYRWRMRNASDDIHPMHLHRHSFELTQMAGKPAAGLIKDVVMLGGYQEIEVDFTADNPGLTLFHCHMQLHMDFGFMGLFNYV